MNTAPSFFHGADNVDASSKLPFFPPNFLGRLRVDLCKGIIRRNGDKMFIVEFTVLTSNIPDRVYVNGRHSWCQNMKEPMTALPTCIAFLLACLGLDQGRDKVKIDTEIKPKQNTLLNNAVDASNPLQGSELMLQTALKPLKGQTNLEAAIAAGKVFTLHNFSPVEQAAA